ncbi:MAG: hypothetical protein J6T52_09350 [Bacteroidaceae bacterium]|nr:hypothetical protein [Bacteroidaceae bacterium]
MDIDKVPNGLKCRCFCPHCKSPLIAKNDGTVREHHFAHEAGKECRNAIESALHLLAKEIIKEECAIMLPESEGGLWPNGYVQLQDVAIEKYDSEFNIKPDAEGILPDGQRLLIEFLVSHRVSTNKRQIIVDNNLLCVEIDLNYQKQNKASMRNFLLKTIQDRKWVQKEHPKIKSGLESFSYNSNRNPLQIDAINILIKRFNDKSLSYTFSGIENNFNNLGYDICEPNSKKYRKFNSDLLLLKSSNPEDDLISINVRGRGRNEGFRFPDGLKVIDIIVTGKYEMEKIFANNSLKSGYYVRFYGFGEEHSTIETSFYESNWSFNSYVSSNHNFPLAPAFSSNNNDPDNDFSLFDVDEPQSDIVGKRINNSSSFDEDEQDPDIVGKWILVSINEIDAEGHEIISEYNNEDYYLTLRNDNTFEDNINNEIGYYQFYYYNLDLTTNNQLTKYKLYVKTLSHNTLEIVDADNRIFEYRRDTAF